MLPFSLSRTISFPSAILFVPPSHNPATSNMSSNVVDADWRWRRRMENSLKSEDRRTMSALESSSKSKTARRANRGRNEGKSGAEGERSETTFGAQDLNEKRAGKRALKQAVTYPELKKGCQTGRERGE